MKNRDLKQSPTAAELYALERKARAMRASEMARLLRGAVEFVKKGVHHA